MIPGQPAPMTQTPDTGADDDANSPVTIDAVVALLRDDRMRGFRIDVETDQLVENDQQIEKQRATEFITAVGQFLGEFGPMVQTMPMLAPMAGAMLNFAVRRFKTGRELEEIIEQTMAKVSEALGNPAPPAPSPEDQAKIAKAQADLQATQIRAQAEHDKAQIDAQATITKAQAEHQQLALAAQNAQAEHDREMARAEQKHMHDLAMAEAEHQRAMEKHAIELKKLDQQMQIAQQQHELKKAEAEHQHRLGVAQAEHQASLGERETKAKEQAAKKKAASHGD